MATAVARMSAPRRVCFFGTYSREHTVTRVLRQALMAAGCEVVDCHAPLWEETRDKLPGYFAPRSLARLAMAYVRRATRLAAALRNLPAPDCFLVGFNGQLDVLLFRLLRRSAPLLFAPLVTLTETLVEDRRVYSPRSLMARVARRIDSWSLRLPDRVVIDTEAHREYLIRELGVHPAAVAAWHLGADRDVFQPRPARLRADPLRVLFYGQFLPLHGVETILGAIEALAGQPGFEFTVIGTGPEWARTVGRVTRREHLTLTEWVPYAELGQAVAAADVCIGSLGTSAKARMVIPNKVYQAAAVGRPVITADTPAIREVFTPGDNIVVCPSGDPAALAEAIQSLRNDAERLRLGAQAQRLMAARFSPAEQAARLAAAVRPLIEL